MVGVDLTLHTLRPVLVVLMPSCKFVLYGMAMSFIFVLLGAAWLLLILNTATGVW